MPWSGSSGSHEGYIVNACLCLDVPSVFKDMSTRHRKYECVTLRNMGAGTGYGTSRPSSTLIELLSARYDIMSVVTGFRGWKTVYVILTNSHAAQVNVKNICYIVTDLGRAVESVKPH